MIFNFHQFSKLFEGGAAIKDSRAILEREVEKTVSHIKEVLLPLIGDGEMESDYILIGSIGKKKNPDDTSGDIDLGISKDFLKKKFRINEDQILDFLFSKLEKELPAALGYEPEMKLMKGINVISLQWPIEGNKSNGMVQLDLIPIGDMNWAKFIYYSPDYRKDESRYKSAHRNWLFQAILSSLKNIKDVDENGNPLEFDTYVLRLSDGIFKNTKSFRGVTKRLSRPKILDGTTKFITKDPQETIDLMFGPGYKEENFKTFEDAWKIVTSPNFTHKEKISEIANDLVRYLGQAGYVIPEEVKKFTTNEAP
jgi:hypothetical protein